MHSQHEDRLSLLQCRRRKCAPFFARRVETRVVIVVEPVLQRRRIKVRNRRWRRQRWRMVRDKRRNVPSSQSQ